MGQVAGMVDRLVESPVIVLCTTRSGSTLLRCLLDAHPAIRAPHELHLADLRVELASPYVRMSLDVAGLEVAEVEHLLWDRLLHRELRRCWWLRSGAGW
jgi:LPS sulfotransferase NodH